MLAGTYTVSASRYLQTIFRVQNPCNINGQIKKYGYVFDFAPDRTLKMVADAVSLSTKAGKTTENQKKLLGEFLNYCPVISISGSEMSDYNVQGMLEQLKKASIDKAVKNGFEDSRLYNDELLKLTDVELKQFDNLKTIVGASKPSKKVNEIDVNNQGLTEEEREKAERAEKKPKAERTPEEQAILDKAKAQKTQRDKAISILRAISIRMPLLIYGAEIDFEKDVKITDLLNDEIIDPKSWDEFMPSKVTKELFKEFIKYYDEDIFIGAARKIRDIAKSAEFLSPTERVVKIANLFKCFKNPDKETVLTPWRVVNMHLGDCLGGYNFLTQDRQDTTDKPVFIDNGEVTQDTLANDNAKILEINSKTGLYPLYVAYSIFKTKCEKYNENDLTEELQERLWQETVENNIFVICKTPMAKQITKRTLVGYKNIKVDSEMEFDAIVGNPPYQLTTAGNDNGAQAKPIYHLFIKQAINLNPHFVSMITPSRWFAGGWGLDEFRKEMLSCNNIRIIHDFKNSSDCFSNVDIKGGISYILYDLKYQGMCKISSHENGNIIESERFLQENGCDVFIRNDNLVSIYHKIKQTKYKPYSSIVSGRSPYGFNTNHYGNVNKINKNDVNYFERKGMTYVPLEKITRNIDTINKYKLFVPKTAEDGKLPGKVIGNVTEAEHNTICSGTYLLVGPFDTKKEMENAKLYMQSKLFRILVAINKITQDAASKVYSIVPIQDFTDKSDINWDESIENIDKQLYQKYDLDENEISFIESMIKPME